MLMANALVKRGVLRGFMPALAILVLAAAPAWSQQNTKVSNVLRLFDIDGNFQADFSKDELADTDGDGLPDTWEVGGVDVEFARGDQDVPFPAPTAIIPGLAPRALFARTIVRTSATASDTDGDGLTDFIEVFGLKFIDDNNNGILDFEFTDTNGNGVWDPGEETAESEWADLNGDGMPSIGEFPFPNPIQLSGGETSPFDFDGFVFTDPTTLDTDADGTPDGQDNDPLINPTVFGVSGGFFPSERTGNNTDTDFDNDGLGNGMDMGNDITKFLDNPADLRRVLEFFRPNLIEAAAGGEIRIPEALIEELLNVDWNGDGLFIQVDARRTHFGVDSRFGDRTLDNPRIKLFTLEDDDGNEILLYAPRPFPTDLDGHVYFTAERRDAVGVPTGLPWQEALQPLRRDSNVFLPDPRIWTVLYAWRMPGFDIDGNGFIGVEGTDNFVNGVMNTDDPDDAITVVSTFPIVEQQPSVDGVIDAAFPADVQEAVQSTLSVCFSSAVILVAFSLVGLACTGRRRD